MLKIILCFFSVIILLGCAEQKPNSEREVEQKNQVTVDSLTKGQKPKDSIFFFLNPVLEKEYVFKTTMQQTVTQTSDTQKVETKQQQSVVYSLKPKSISQTGLILFEVSFKSIEQKIHSPLISFELNTKKKRKENTPIETFYNSLIGKLFYLRVGKNGSDVEIFGVDSLINNIVNEILAKDEFKGADKASLSHIISSFFNSSELKKNFEKFFEIYPKKPVSISEPWTNIKTIQEPLPAEIQNQFQIKSISGDTLQLTLKSKVNFKKIEQKERDVNITNLKGSQEGIFYVSYGTGLILKSKIIQNVSLLYSFPPTPQTQNKSLTIPTFISTTFQLEVLQ
ncbi:MAG: DUF6263 family protein [Ignavibacteria bacterium]|nr:DUF6263 family protein [Ignavibacteria bacterium]